MKLSLLTDGVTISVGGEIGEVGKENSNEEELLAYLDGYRRELEARAPGAIGISKVSVQTGTSHGGVVIAIEITLGAAIAGPFAVDVMELRFDDRRNGDEHRGKAYQRMHRRDQLRVLRLGLVDQDIDGDRPGALRVERCRWPSGSTYTGRAVRVLTSDS